MIIIMIIFFYLQVTPVLKHIKWIRLLRYVNMSLVYNLYLQEFSQFHLDTELVTCYYLIRLMKQYSYPLRSDLLLLLGLHQLFHKE